MYADNYFDLAIVDPQYGINAPNMPMGTNKSRTENGYPAVSTAMKIKKELKSNSSNWDDKPPPKEYFEELFRVSKNQIIWGGNYFDLPPTRGIIAWDKKQPWDNFSQFELAWTSFDKPAALFSYSNTGGANTEIKIHPTQKPIALYEWLLSKRANFGDKILDTHVGSASSLIACYNLGFEYTGFEIDKDMFIKSNDRLEIHKSQMRLF